MPYEGKSKDVALDFLAWTLVCSLGAYSNHIHDTSKIPECLLVGAVVGLFCTLLKYRIWKRVKKKREEKANSTPSN